MQSVVVVKGGYALFGSFLLAKEYSIGFGLGVCPFRFEGANAFIVVGTDVGELVASGDGLVVCHSGCAFHKCVCVFENV